MMRIAYLNPLKAAAEDPGYASLSAAGRAQGIDVIACANEGDIAAYTPDFVLSVSSSVPKIVDLPSYLFVHESKQKFLENQFHMRNLLSYDGFATTSADLRRFLGDIEFGVRRHGEICTFCPAPEYLPQNPKGDANFSAESMLSNLVDYHARRISARPARLARAGAEAQVSVIVCCGGRDVKMVKRAVDSIRGQTFGRFSVIFIKYRPIDLSSITAQAGERIAGFTEVDTPGGNRSQTLFTGLRHISTPYFAVLDDDDWWMSDHMEGLFAAGRADDPAFDVAYSGVIGVDYPVELETNLVSSRNIYAFGIPAHPRTIFDVTGAVQITGFVARGDLLPPELCEPPEMETAHDSMLLAILCRRAIPVFSYRATAFYTRCNPDGSGWATHPERGEDIISYQLRAKLALAPTWLSDFWTPLPAAPAEPVVMPAAPKAPAVASEFPTLEAEIAALRRSTSWRVTAPLRWLRRVLAGDRNG